MSAPVREWVAPWDEPWVKVHKLTKPMFVTLYDLAERGTGSGAIRRIYPGGQWRLIRAGLYRRALIDEHGRVTMAGHVLTIWAKAAMTRAYPARPGEVTTR
jgi:hypothetical protein